MAAPSRESAYNAAGHWGHEFRSLFHAPDGMVLVGVDLIGLEARILAHYLATWDFGAYTGRSQAALTCT